MRTIQLEIPEIPGEKPNGTEIPGKKFLRKISVYLQLIGAKTQHEYIRVTYGYIRVHTSTYEYIRVHTSTYEYIRVHTSTYEYIRVTYEYIRVTYEYIRVAYEYIQVTYGYKQTHTVTYRLHTNTLVTYEYIYIYIGATYDGRRVRNTKCTIFLFHYIFIRARVITFIQMSIVFLHTHASARNCHTRAGTTPMHVYHTHTSKPKAVFTRQT